MTTPHVRPTVGEVAAVARELQQITGIIVNFNGDHIVIPPLGYRRAKQLIERIRPTTDNAA